MKRCIKCNKLLSTHKFSKRTDNNKRRNTCKKCIKIRTFAWRLKNIKSVKEKHKKSLAEYYKKVKGLKNQILMFNPCIICKEKRIGCLDFHHLDPSIKETQIGHCHSPKKLMRELTKCVVLCANCHRLYHLGEIQLPNIINPFVKPHLVSVHG